MAALAAGRDYVPYAPCDPALSTIPLAVRAGAWSGCGGAAMTVSKRAVGLGAIAAGVVLIGGTATLTRHVTYSADDPHVVTDTASTGPGSPHTTVNGALMDTVGSAYSMLAALNDPDNAGDTVDQIQSAARIRTGYTQIVLTVNTLPHPSSLSASLNNQCVVYSPGSTQPRTVSNASAAAGVCVTEH